MRDMVAAMAIVMASAATAAAQQTALPTVRNIQSLQQLVLADPLGTQARLSADDVLARMMSFDRDRDGKIATTELSERMQTLVGRGDRSGDGVLDESEIRLLATSQQFAVRSLSGGYGFGDISGLSSRNHIENSIDDLRLAPDASREAKRIAVGFFDEFQTAAATNLRKALAPVIPEHLLGELEAALTRLNGVPMRVTKTSADGTRVISVAPLRVTQESLSSDQLGAVRLAADALRAEQQFDDARRAQLMARLSGLLTEEESENLGAALARRPLVKAPGSSLVQAISPAMNEFQLRVQQSAR